MPVKDSTRENFLKFFKVGTKFLDRAEKSKGKVRVRGAVPGRVSSVSGVCALRGGRVACPHHRDGVSHGVQEDRVVGCLPLRAGAQTHRQTQYRVPLPIGQIRGTSLSRSLSLVP